MEAKRLKIDASRGIDNMPHEILVKILSYLPHSDLKKARLVCRPWNEVSKDVQILKHQNFVLTGSKKNRKEIFNRLAHPRFKYCNLKFVHVELGSVFERFVSSHGAKIYSLSFQKCTFSFKIIESIMIYCINLKELNFELELSSNSCNTLKIPTDLQIPMANGQQIVREKLSILRFIFPEEFSSDLLSIFMSVYPSIEELYLTPDNYYNSKYYKYEPIAQKCYQIPKFCLQIPEGSCFEDYSTMFTDENLPAIRDKLSVGGSHVQLLRFTRHYTSITELEVGEMKFVNLPIIFQNFPNLEHLKLKRFSYGDAVTDISKVLKLIAASRLKSLSLGFSYYHETRDDEIIDDIPWMNQYMERFSIEAKCFSHDLVIRMLKMFPNLTSLRFIAKLHSEIVLRDVTSYIFGRLVKLKCLWLDVILRNRSVDSRYEENISPNAVNDASFDNCNFLPNLEHLTLKGCNTLTEQGIEKFVNFPNLKFLNMERSYNIRDGGVAKLTKNLPDLEWLDISRISICNDTLFQICNNLKYLRRLVLENRYVDKPLFTSEETIIEMFRRCPTLRSLKPGHNDLAFYNYYKNTILNRWGDPHISNYSNFY